MKLNFATAFLLAASGGRLPTGADAQTTYPCPAAGVSAPLPLTPAHGSTTVRLPVVSAASGLCLLTRRAASTGAQRATVARSHAGAAAGWERSPGLFAKTGSGASVDCGAGSAAECDVTLPALEDGQEYVLESYEYGISAEAEAARFLEQATFGATRETIDALLSTSNDYATWIEDQLSLPASSHRAFLRSHTNPKYEFPYNVGATGPRPCEQYSRWRRYAITSRDMLSNRKTGWYKHFTVEAIGGKYVWKVDGHFRTVTDEDPGLILGERYRILHWNHHTWKTDCVGCDVKVEDTSGASTTIPNPQVSIAGIEGNAAILPYGVVNLPDFKSNDLPTMENSDEYPMFAPWIHPFEHALLNTTSLEGSGECDGFPTFRQPFPLDGVDSPPGAFPTVFGRSFDATTGEEIVFAYDPHLALYENTVENPLLDGGGQLAMDTHGVIAGTQALCQNARRSFLNEDGCKLSFQSNACSPKEDPTEVVIINESNLAGINSMTGSRLYALTSLPITADVDPVDGTAYLKAPCSSARSRWVRDPSDTTCANTAGLGDLTMRTFSNLINGRGMRPDIHYNPNVVEVFRSYSDCDSQDDTKLILGNVRAGDGTCWKHMHINELSVFDLAGADTSKYTITGSATATVNDMSWFYSTVLPLVGYLDDHVEVNNDLPSQLDIPSVLEAYSSLDYNPAEGSVLVCGSPNEVASDPFHGDRGFDVVQPEGTGFRSFAIWEYAAAKHTTWTDIALHSADQLRQKMAWSLSQIVAVGLPDSGTVFNEETEHYTAFYDMFVNNAFGNYLDLMKEFSFNSIMGGWLSFKGNKSLQYNIEKEGKANYPDENFAREIMQLFSIGLYQMNMDGTNILREDGMPKETYQIDDIMSYARAWTGFDSPLTRGGVSTAERQWNDKVIDPMDFSGSARDQFPKSDLIGGYIGDRIALCEDLPPKHFLRKGATYHALGAKTAPAMHNERSTWSEDPDFRRLSILPSSPLYQKLCAADVNGDCTFPSKIVLEENLVYDAVDMTGDEYAVDTIRTVQLSVAGLSTPFYYEYIRQPCVLQSFYNNAKKVIKGQIWGDYVIEPSLCGNPGIEIAAPMCVESGWETVSRSGKVYCNYQGERMTYAGAEAICAAEGREIGHPWGFKDTKSRGGPCHDGGRDANYRSWSAAWCKTQVKIDFISGNIAIVNEVEPDHSGAAAVEGITSPETINFFRAYWKNDIYPSDANACLAEATCTVYNGESCICDTDVVESAVFASADGSLTIAELMMELTIGAVDPATFDSGIYTPLGDCGIQGGVTVYSKSGGCSGLSSDSVFAFEWKSKQYFLKNSRSSAHISGSNVYSFSNPVQFINFVNSEVRDMYHETDAVLDSLFYHPTHPPFMATRVIQRFGISNPSPDFVERVAMAYGTGSYDNGRFGSGKYGDLGAMVAAILLDDVARSVSLDADPAQGSVREPLIKVLSFFRSMGVRYESPLHLPTLLSSESKIGQGSYESPSVFSFFLPEFTPSVEAVQSAELVAPESMVLSGDNVLDLLDSIFSTIKFGINNCYKPTLEGYRVGLPFGCASEEGDTSFAPARPNYWPASTSTVDDILNDLDVLLTAGRLTDKNRALIKSIVEPEFNAGNVAKAVRMAQQLVFATPELHSTGLTRNLNDKRELEGYTEPPTAPYRAVVVLMMIGGADSFNLLVPTGGCATADQYQEYLTERGPAHSLPMGNLTAISAASSDQDCAQFGVNHEFGYLAQLYNDSDALFFANTGLLARPMTKHDDWTGLTPHQLFAHNTMQHEFYRNDPYDANANTGVFGRLLDKLKLQGFQTSANAAGAGGTMLTGDQQYNNPVNRVSTKAPSPLNLDPTIENIYEIVKQLNGVGELDSNVMSETWSAHVARALFEHEQMQEIAGMPEFDIDNFGDGSNSGLTGRLRAVLEFMKSRSFRNVNREVYVVKQDGFDHHGTNGVSDNFRNANGALTEFIAELKNQGLWDNTVIVMGSDFGRSLNPNSNDGTDHAWGGNYFMAGGSVRGGRILGRYPQPLNPSNDYWIGRGRLIPTTPWDAIWNGIGQWLGVHDDADLKWVIPNRDSFDECTDLFSDTDLFDNGSCTCSECIPQTYSPTPSPVDAPTDAPFTEHEAEDPNEAIFDSTSHTSSGKDGASGGSFVNMGGNGSWLEYFNLDGGSTGGTCAFSFRYANGEVLDRPAEITLNGVNIGTLGFPNSGGWETWIYDSIETTCTAGINVIRMTATSSEGGANIDSLKYSAPQDDTTPSPTNAITPQPTPNPTPGSTPEPTTSPAPITLYEGESANFDSTGKVSSGNSGWTGSGYANMGGNGSWVEFDNVDGGSGGVCTLSFRYAVGSDNARECSVIVNGSPVGTLSFTSTGSWSTWGTESIDTICSAGNNVIRVTATTSEGGPNLDSLAYSTPGGSPPTPSTPNPTSQLTPNPTPQPTPLPSDQPTNQTPPPTSTPTPQPSDQPTDEPTPNPTPQPTPLPSDQPTNQTPPPTSDPTPQPSDQPTDEPTPNPTPQPTPLPSNQPTNQTPPPTPAPTPQPSDQPTDEPTPNPTPQPTPLPSDEPTNQPTTLLPTNSPNQIPPAVGEPVNSIFDANSAMTSFGCVNGEVNNQNRKAFDRTTEKYYCQRSGVPSGIIGIPSHGKYSVVKAIRLYSHNNCPNCDAVDYILEGRVGPSSHWVVIDSGDFDWKDQALPRNTRGQSVSSTYESPDPNLNVTVVDLSSNVASFLEYRATFPTTRSPDASHVQFAEIELPGLLFDEHPDLTASPTANPSQKPTPVPTSAPTSVPTSTPTPGPTMAPVTASPTAPPVLNPTNSPIGAIAGTAVNTVIPKGSTVSDFGCGRDQGLSRAIDGTTEKYLCRAPDLPHSGLTFVPKHGKMSIVKGIRLYAHNNCDGCDAVSYILEGRVDSSSDWTMVGSGDFDWKDQALPRNDRGQSVSSTYESPDVDLEVTVVDLSSNVASFLEYRVTFTEIRVSTSLYYQFAEIELPGFVL